MPLFGRAGELERIDQLVAAGGQRAALIVGEAGIGKSALLGVLRERAAAAGMLVLHGVGAEHERDVPFAAVVDAFDDHVASLNPRRIEALSAELGHVLPSVAGDDGGAGAGERFRYHRALRSLVDLLARERPVCLVIDDLHWADDATVEFVLHLLRRPIDGPLLLALGTRPAAVADRVLDALRRAGGEPLVLEPLSSADAELLLGDAFTGDRRRVLAEAGGNPLFLSELAKVTGDRLPPTLVAAVRLELDALPTDSRALIEAASVAGDPFDLGLAAAAWRVDDGSTTDALEPLVAADLVRAAGPLLRFRHPVIRRAVYEAMPAAARLFAHEAVAAELEKRGAGPAARAYHVAAYARPGDAAAVALLSAAAAATRDRAPAAAARWYEAALALLDPAAADGLPLRVALAEAYADGGQVTEAHATLVGLIDGWPEDDATGRIGLVAACAGLEQVLGRHDEARARIDRAFGGLPGDAPAELRAALAFERAADAIHAADVEGLTAFAGQASAIVSDGALWVADQSLVATAALYAGDARAAADIVRRAADRFATMDEAELVARPDVAYYLGWSQIHLMWLNDAAATTARGLELARRSNRGSWLPLLAALHSVARFNLGEPEAALEVLETAEESSRLQGLDNALAWVLWMQATAYDLRGNGTEARRRGDECLRIAASLADGALAQSAWWAVALVHADDDPERLIREIKSAVGDDLEAMEPQRSTTLLAVLIGAAFAIGDEAEGRRLAAVLEERARDLEGIDAARSRAAAGRALVALADGDAKAAVAAARIATVTADGTSVVVDQLAGRLLLGRALAAAGDRDAAIDALRELTQLAEATGALKYADAAARELRRLGIRQTATARRGGTEPGRAGLSAREVEVAELAAAGRSNKEIAAALFLSVKTIENHLSRVFAQMGVRSRVELAGVWGSDRGSTG